MIAVAAVVSIVHCEEKHISCMCKASVRWKAQTKIT